MSDTINLLKTITGTLHAYRPSQYPDLQDALECGGIYDMSDENEWTYSTLTDTMITIKKAADMMEHQAEVNIFMCIDGKYVPAELVQDTYFNDGLT